jgi:hypothetical protein
MLTKLKTGYASLRKSNLVFSISILMPPKKHLVRKRKIQSESEDEYEKEWNPDNSNDDSDEDDELITTMYKIIYLDLISTS